MNKNSKGWLVFMCGNESVEDLKDMVEPIHHLFNGLVVTCHAPPDSQNYQYLQSRVGEGKIIHLPYSQRHDFSRNAYLYCGPIKNGDWCVQTDVLEHPQASFLENIEERLADFGPVSIFYYYGKPFVFKYSEYMSYVGSPHESLTIGGRLPQGVELSMVYQNENEVRRNMRPIKRPDPFNWVDHYAKYMLFPLGSNHSLLGLSERGDPQKLFPARENLRYEFLLFLEERGIERSLSGLKKLFSGELDARLRKFVNGEKVWQDFYRYHILGDTTVVDEHKWTSMQRF